MLYVIVSLVVLAGASLLAGWTLSALLLHPPRRAISCTPGEYALHSENVSFASKDGLELRGWWMPAVPDHTPVRAGSTPVVILLHPMFGNRQTAPGSLLGLTCPWPSGTDMLGLARSFHVAGFACLVFDFRGHGESESGVCAGGYNEDQDVVGAVDYVYRRMATEEPDRAPQAGLVGFGLGARAAITAIGREKGDGRTIRVFSADNENATGMIEFKPPNIKKLRFLVAVEPVSLRAWLRSFLRRISPLLAWLLVPIVNWFFSLRSGYPLDGNLLVQFARDVYTPVLYVKLGQDDVNSSEELERLYDATSGVKQLWPVGGQAAGVRPDEPSPFPLEYVTVFASQFAHPTTTPS